MDQNFSYTAEMLVKPVIYAYILLMNLQAEQKKL